VAAECDCSLIGCRVDSSTGICTCGNQYGDADGGAPATSCPDVPGQQCCLSDNDPTSCHCGDAPCELAEHAVPGCALSDLMVCIGPTTRVSSCK
jgi:hypothetical protein